MPLDAKCVFLHPPIYWNEKRRITVVVQLDDFLIMGGMEGLMWLYDTLKENAT